MGKAKDLRFLWPTDSLSGRPNNWEERLLGKKNPVFGFLSCLLARPRVQFDTVNQCNCVCGGWIKDKKHWRRKKRRKEGTKAASVGRFSSSFLQTASQHEASEMQQWTRRSSLPVSLPVAGRFFFLRGYGQSPMIGLALRYGGHGNQDEYETQLNG